MNIGVESQPLTRFLIVDDHPLYVGALETVIRSLVPSATISSAQTSQAMRAKLRSAAMFDCVFLDLGLHDATGIEALLACRRAAPLVPVVVVSGSDSAKSQTDCLEAGATAFVPKTGAPSVMYDFLQTFINTGLVPEGPDGNSTPAPVSDLLSGLTDRECEVAMLLAKGYANKRIADELDIQVGTVKAHVSKLFKAFGVSNRAQAALLLRRHLN